MRKRLRRAPRAVTRQYTDSRAMATVAMLLMYSEISTLCHSSSRVGGR